MGRARSAKWAAAAIAAVGVICATGGLFGTCMKMQSETIMGQAEKQVAGERNGRGPDRAVDEPRIPFKRGKADANRLMERRGKRAPAYTPSLDFGDSDVETASACRDNQAIERYARQSGVDPMLVRAIMAVESGFDGCSAAKVCRPGFAADDCDNSGVDFRYELGIDEVDDAESGCRLPPAPEINGEPAWRWFGFGFGKTVGAPGEIRPEGSVESECDDSFNPFSPDDAACAVSVSMEKGLESARAIVDASREVLERSLDERQMEDLVGYIAANMYSGDWNARVSAVHPRCSNAMSFGQCLLYNYMMNAGIDRNYCGSDEGRADERCSGGEPRYEPPEACYGNIDIAAFARDCEVPLRPDGGRDDYGSKVMSAYYRLRNECRGRR